MPAPRRHGGRQDAFAANNDEPDVPRGWIPGTPLMSRFARPGETPALAEVKVRPFWREKERKEREKARKERRKSGR